MRKYLDRRLETVKGSLKPKTGFEKLKTVSILVGGVSQKTRPRWEIDGEENTNIDEKGGIRKRRELII